jgi:hypothetical protein
VFHVPINRSNAYYLTNRSIEANDYAKQQTPSLRARLRAEAILTSFGEPILDCFAAPLRSQ